MVLKKWQQCSNVFRVAPGPKPEEAYIEAPARICNVHVCAY